MPSQLELFTYSEALDLTEAHFLALDTLYHRLQSTDVKFWNTDSLNAAAHADAMKRGMSEWYPLDRIPALQDRSVYESLTGHGWVEVGEHKFWNQEKALCARITNTGVEAWHRHSDACFEAGMRAIARETPARRRRSTAS
jgi:hypothetical protein